MCVYRKIVGAFTAAFGQPRSTPRVCCGEGGGQSGGIENGLCVCLSVWLSLSPFSSPHELVDEMTAKRAVHSCKGKAASSCSCKVVYGIVVR